MKFQKIISLIMMLAFFRLPVNAQKLTPEYNIGKIYNAYLAIKNALADNEGTAAKIKANELYFLLAKHPDKGLNRAQWKLLSYYLEPLLNNSRSIAITVSLDEQRPYFAKLSTAMYEVLKGLKINTSPIYEQYCPMNKLYWLSETTTIKNPYYYGKDMLSYGKVVAIIRPVR